MAKTLPITARHLQKMEPFANHLLIAQIVTLIEQRAALTVRRLAREESDEMGERLDGDDNEH